VRNDQGRTLVPGDHVGHGERLARTGDPQQRLEGLVLAQPFRELFDGLRLIALRPQIGYQFKSIHNE